MKRCLNLLFLCVAAITAPQTLATTFKIATVAPDGSSWMNEMRAAAREIQQRTDGRVVFRFYPGGIMGNDKSVLRKIRVGQLHGGAITGGGLADILPEAQVYSLPFLFQDYAEADYVRRKMDPLLLQRLEKAGYVSFGISEGGFAYLMSGTPVAGIADLKERKVWVPEGDAISRSAFKATGISPISLPLTDVLTGLQTGLIDTVAATPTGAIALQWHTRVKYINSTPLMYIYGTLLLKRRAFNKIDEADRKVVGEVLERSFVRLNRQNRNDNNGALDALRNQGIGLVESTPEEIRRWKAVVGAEMERLIRDRLFEPEIYRQIQRHIEDYRSTQATK